MANGCLLVHAPRSPVDTSIQTAEGACGWPQQEGGRHHVGLVLRTGRSTQIDRYADAGARAFLKAYGRA